MSWGCSTMEQSLLPHLLPAAEGTGLAQQEKRDFTSFEGFTGQDDKTANTEHLDMKKCAVKGAHLLQTSFTHKVFVRRQNSHQPQAACGELNSSPSHHSFTLMTDILGYTHPHAEKTVWVRLALTQPPISYEQEAPKNPISANFPVQWALEDSPCLLMSWCRT